jgi:hypothetical protein
MERTLKAEVWCASRFCRGFPKAEDALQFQTYSVSGRALEGWTRLGSPGILG